MILDHHRHPRNKGHLEQATAVVELDNPLCGDEIVLELALAEEAVAAVAFDGRGCSVSQASASMLTEGIAGKSLDHARALLQAVKDAVRGGEFDVELLGDAEVLQWVQTRPSRFRCALLPWEALERALAEALRPAPSQ